MLLGPGELLPTSARRLMSTPRSQYANIISLASGNYVHISLRSTLIEVVNRGGWDHDKIEITLGVIGVGRGKMSELAVGL